MKNNETTDIEIKSTIIHRPAWIANPTTFVNTREFSREAQNFLKYGYYTKAPKGTYEYREYWEEQTRRCLEGYTVGGITITGRYYDYLNFTQIKATVKDSQNRERKILTFPQFLDIDYYYYNEIEEAMNEGVGLCVAKARRKGFSFKNAQLCKYDFNFIKDSVSVIGAYLDEYSSATMSMSIEMLNFINKNTAWSKRRTPDTKDFLKARYKKIINGQEVWAGYNSELYTLTFHNNASAAIGKSISLMLWEEAGKWNNLIDSYDLTLPTFVDGDVTTGFWIVFGTGGDMDSGASVGFEKLFTNPTKYKLRAYDMKDYDPEMSGLAGFFVDDTWYKPPYISDEGVSKRDIALKANLQKRKELEEGSNSTKSVDNFLTQYPIYPREAFLTIQGSYLPSKQLYDQLTKILTDKKLSNIGIRGTVEDVGGKVSFVQNDKLIQATYPYDPNTSEGCIVIYEFPEYVNGTIPFGLYLASTDPYMHDEAKESDSLGATYIYKKFYSAGKTSDIIVAEYVGRPKTTEEYYENVRKLLLFYSAKCLYENQFKDMKTHFYHKNSLHLLAQQPYIIKDIIPKSVVNRAYGVHMPKELKQAATIYLRDWLLKEKSPGINNISEIYSVPLLQECIKFNFNQNFDRVSSMLILMLYIQDTNKIIINDLKTNKESFFSEFFKQTGWSNLNNK